jgi:hypothetical protein
MPVAVYVGRRLVKALFPGVALVPVGELPDVDAVAGLAAELDRAPFAEKIQRFLKILRIDVRRPLSAPIAPF